MRRSLTRTSGTIAEHFGIAVWIYLILEDEIMGKPWICDSKYSRARELVVEGCLLFAHP
jgi:hypothetical protein